MITDNVVILTPTMRETLEALTTKCIAEEYFGDHIAAVRDKTIGDNIGLLYARGGQHIWQFSDAEVEALLCAIDCLTDETKPDHFWQADTKTVAYLDVYGYVRSIKLQKFVDLYLRDSHTMLPGLYE